ncbi:MAG: phage portal protein [Phreatobacter sp.]|uniref:phage portal protein n=1 Tax=Phreatobacter sp. TaxID=1966341 RepID=UPI001A43B472|nr:phage portal protein [Phreatobacter sp.]MBL8570951.1 phage portal protein [Phreatobacter sp.]
MLARFFRKAAPIEQKSGLAAPEDWLLELFGVSAATSVGVSASTALTVPAVASAVRVISEAAASLSRIVVEIQADDSEKELPDHPLTVMLNGDVNEWTSGYEFIRDLVSEALTRDAGGFAWANRPRGDVMELIKYDVGRFTVDYDWEGTGEPTYRKDGLVVPRNDVIHLRGPFSKSPLTLAREAIGLAYLLEAYAGRLFKNGARPGGVVTFPNGMGEEQLKKMRAGWKKVHEGADNAGSTALLWGGASFTQSQMTSVDAQFLEMRRFQILEIARAFRVPPSMLFDLERATWSNGEQQGKEFLTYCLEPWLQALEAALRRGLFHPDDRARYRVVFDRDDLTRADLTARATAINGLIASRTINPNEGRDWLGMKPRAGGEEFANPNVTVPVPTSTEQQKEPAT